MVSGGLSPLSLRVGALYNSDMLFYVFFLFVFGLVVGSFLNVLISRLGTREPIVRGRSHCDHCAKALRWFELVPIASFVWQKGRCRSCRGAISPRFIVVEVITGLLFVSAGLGAWSGYLVLPAAAETIYGGFDAGFIGSLAVFVYFAFLASGAVAISFYDLERRVIPKVLVWPLAAAGLLVQLIFAADSGDSGFLISTLLLSSAAFAFFWLIWFLSGGVAMGRGDADVALAIGLYLGPRLALTSFVLSFWLGAAVGLIMVGFGKLGWRSQIAFAPFLFAGAMLALVLPVDFASLFGF